MTSFAVKLKRRIFLRLLEASALGGFCLLVLGGSYCWAVEQLNKSQSRYIGIDEVRPGMDAYCLTDYKDAEIEKFGLEVLSVVRGIRPGQDAILVQGTDERFIHTGPVWGCSGSPVYIDGRLAGALAFTWSFSKDPLYGVTPIKEILKTIEWSFPTSRDKRKRVRLGVPGSCSIFPIRSILLKLTGVFNPSLITRDPGHERQSTLALLLCRVH